MAKAKKVTKKKTPAKKKKKPVKAQTINVKTTNVQTVKVEQKSTALSNKQVFALAAIGFLLIVSLLAYAIINEPIVEDHPDTIIPNVPNTSSTTTHPIFTIVTDPTCEVCNSDNVADIIRIAYSGITVREVESTSDEGQQLIAEISPAALPMYIFNEDVEFEENFTQFETVLRKVNEHYVLDERVPGLIVRYVTPFDIAGEPTTNEAETKVVIVEFSDPNCGACRVFNTKTKPLLLETYGDDLKIVFKSMPLSEASLMAAHAMECAFEQGTFWEYTELIYTVGSDLVDLTNHTETLGMNVTAYDECMESGKYLDEVMADRAEGVERGVTGTPTLFINGIKITGVPAMTDLQDIIALELAQ